MLSINLLLQLQVLFSTRLQKPLVAQGEAELLEIG